MTASDLRRRLRDAPVPGEHEARERGWRVVRAAYTERRPVPPPATAPKRLAIALGLAAIVLAVVLTPAGAKVVDLVRDVVRPSAKEARPLTSLPASGSLLVQSQQGPWVFHRDGSQRLLGDYREASWSPNGVYVAVTSNDQLSAVEPDGNVHWSINVRHPSDPRWVPGTGFRIAYRSGSSMRVVHGDGSHDHLLDASVGPAAPAWRPSQLPQAKAEAGGPGEYVLALAKPDGSVELVGAGSGHLFWRSGSGPQPRVLDWSADGTWLAALSANEVRIFSALDGHLIQTVQLPAGMRPTDGEFAPSGKSFAVTGTMRTTHGPRSNALLIPLGAAQPKPRPLLTDPGTFTDVSWSPDGHWLLVAWRDADAWLFLTPRHPGDVQTAGDISRQFSPGSSGNSAFPTPAGWCCTPAGIG
jgi:WD40-like Beta Propeller Repeat